MPQKVFFSWQSDTPAPVGRNLIEAAIKAAIKNLGRDDAIEPAIRDDLELDKDTRGVPGSPPIVETILGKIDGAAAIVFDLTSVARRGNDGIIPNPNVLIEYGWALKGHGHARMISVMNEAFGEVTDTNLPFDLRHMRRPITFRCPEGADSKVRAKAQGELAKDLEAAIRAIVNMPDFLPVGDKPEEPPFQERPCVGTPGRFATPGAPIGAIDNRVASRPAIKVALKDGPVMWFRVFPLKARAIRLRHTEIKDLVLAESPQSIGASGADGMNLFRLEDGIGMFRDIVSAEKGYVVYDSVVIFDTGEIWSLDTRQLSFAMDDRTVNLNEKDFKDRLEHYATVLDKLGSSRPYVWEAGIEGLQGMRLYVPNQDGTLCRLGSCLKNFVSGRGVLGPDGTPAAVLKPFFEDVYDAFGLKRPDWLP